jgi:hemerythrin-like domain-containing protein
LRPGPPPCLRLGSTDPQDTDGGHTVNAITMLTEDHRKVERMLDELESTTERGIKTRHELFARLKDALAVHEAIEEEIFYPALRDHPKAKDIVLEAYEEHDVVNDIMGELESTPVDDETWGAKAKVMTENLRHHIEEEEGEMFPTARKVFDRAELEDLGERMAARRTTAELELAGTAR